MWMQSVARQQRLPVKERWMPDETMEEKFKNMQKYKCVGRNENHAGNDPLLTSTNSESC